MSSAAVFKDWKTVPVLSAKRLRLYMYYWEKYVLIPFRFTIRFIVYERWY